MNTTLITLQSKVFTNYSDWHRAYNTGKDFSAIKIDGKLEPFETGEKEVFVHGKGWKKIGKAKVTHVPALTNETNLNEFLTTYGDKCLYYALTYQRLNSQDCCWSFIQDEFTAMVALGINEWISVLERFNALKAKIATIYMDKWGIVPDNERMQTTKQGKLLFKSNIFTLRFNHYLTYPLRCKPHLDPIEDDNRLAMTYLNCVLNGDYEAYGLDKAFHNTSVEQRLKMLFSEEVSTEYKALMHPFG